MSELSDKINVWMSEAKNDLITNYSRMGLKASGKYERELHPIIKESTLHINAKMLGAKHSYFMENGRKPTTMGGNGNLREIIRAWIDNKGIIPKGISKDSLSYLITRKIHTKGIIVPNKFNSGGVISNVITEKRLQSLADLVKPYFSKQLRSNVIKIFK